MFEKKRLTWSRGFSQSRQLWARHFSYWGTLEGHGHRWLWHTPELHEPHTGAQKPQAFNYSIKKIISHNVIGQIIEQCIVQWSDSSCAPNSTNLHCQHPPSMCVYGPPLQCQCRWLPLSQPDKWPRCPLYHTLQHPAAHIQTEEQLWLIRWQKIMWEIKIWYSKEMQLKTNLELSNRESQTVKNGGRGAMICGITLSRRQHEWKNTKEYVLSNCKYIQAWLNKYKKLLTFMNKNYWNNGFYWQLLKTSTEKLMRSLGCVEQPWQRIHDMNSGCLKSPAAL